MRRDVFYLVCALVVMWMGASESQAQIPQLINYQGYLTDSGGNPINDIRSIQFSLYGVATGGTPLWSETQTVTVVSGNFSVLLGSVTMIPYSVFNGSNVYLELKVGIDPPMTPRKQLVSVGYAFYSNNADNLDGRDDSDFVQVGQTNSISTNMIQGNAVDAGKISPNIVSSIDGVVNDGGNIDLVAGSNVTITPNDGANTITISATPGGGAGDITAVNAGTGLYGGGTSGDVTLNVEVPLQLSSSASQVIRGTHTSGNYGYLACSGVGVCGRHHSGGTRGFLGSSDSGVYGASSSSGYGVYGLSSSGRGVYGAASSGYAGYFDGKVHISGVFTVAGTKAFVIDHPLDPGNKYLYHFCIESNELSNVYTGNVVLDSEGEATVELPDWFEALNRDFRYQLTCIGGFAQVYIAEKISNNRFRIAGGTPGMEVSWQVTGIRRDAFAKANPIQVEVEKEGDNRGTYLHPKAHDVSETLGMDYEEHKRIEEEVEIIEEEHRRMELERERIMKEHEGIE